MKKFFSIRNSENRFIYVERDIQYDDAYCSNIEYASLFDLLRTDQEIFNIYDSGIVVRSLSREIIGICVELRQRYGDDCDEVILGLIQNIFLNGPLEVVEFVNEGGDFTINKHMDFDCKEFLTCLVTGYLEEIQIPKSEACVHEELIDDLIAGNYDQNVTYFIVLDEEGNIGRTAKGSEEELLYIKMSLKDTTDLIIVDDPHHYIGVFEKLQYMLYSTIENQSND